VVPRVENSFCLNRGRTNQASRWSCRQCLEKTTWNSKAGMEMGGIMEKNNWKGVDYSIGIPYYWVRHPNQWSQFLIHSHNEYFKCSIISYVLASAKTTHPEVLVTAETTHPKVLATARTNLSANKLGRRSPFTCLKSILIPESHRPFTRTETKKEIKENSIQSIIPSWNIRANTFLDSSRNVGLWPDWKFVVRCGQAI